MKVMFDANIALDAFQQRTLHQESSALALSKSLDGDIHGVFPAHVVTTIYYILRKSIGNKQASESISWLINVFEIAACDANVLSEAIKSGMPDFEDAVVAYSALQMSCDFIVTRNTADFRQSPIPAILPETLLEKLSKS